MFRHAIRKLDFAEENKGIIMNGGDLKDEAEVEDEASAKYKTIQEITSAGLEVINIIHRHGMDSKTAHEVEAALIDAFPGLTNIQGGRGSQDRGPMHVLQVMTKYDLPELEENPKDKLLLINVPRLKSTDHDEIYQQVRFAWRLNLDRAKNVDYVLAVVRGVVVGVFVANKWDVAVREKINDLPYDVPKKKAFEGKIAAPEIWEKYVGERGKRIVNPEMRHTQNCVRYWPR